MTRPGILLTGLLLGIAGLIYAGYAVVKMIGGV